MQKNLGAWSPLQTPVGDRVQSVNTIVIILLKFRYLGILRSERVYSQRPADYIV